MSMATRLRVLDCYVYPVLCYGSEAWTLTADLKKRLENCEMDFLRKMMRIPYSDKESYEVVLARAGVNRQFIKDRRSRQIHFWGMFFGKKDLRVWQ